MGFVLGVEMKDNNISGSVGWWWGGRESGRNQIK